MAEQRELRDGGSLTRALGAVTRRTRGGNHHDHDAVHHQTSGRSAIMDCGLYVDGARRPGTVHYADALAAARRRPDAFVEPEADEFADIAAVFDLHELPVEDAIGAFQRPKIERYGEMVFAALRTLRRAPGADRVLRGGGDRLGDDVHRRAIRDHRPARRADRPRRRAPRPGGQA